jgi:hypothetical protein
MDGTRQHHDRLFIDAQVWRLYVPRNSDEGPSYPGSLAEILREMASTTVVNLIVEDSEEIRSYLQGYVDPSAMNAIPYLEHAIGGSSAVVLYFIGEDIVPALSEILSAEAMANRAACDDAL